MADQNPWEDFKAPASSSAPAGPWSDFAPQPKQDKFGAAQGVTKDASGAYGSAPEESNIGMLWRAATDPAHNGADPNSIVGGLRQAGGRAMGAIVNPLLHPGDTISGMAKTLNPTDWSQSKARLGEFQDEWKQSPALALENAVGDVAGGVEGGRAMGAVTRPLSEGLGAASQDAGKGIIKKTVGVHAADLKHGADPAQGYFDAGGKVSLSQKGIANLASKANNRFGQQIGSAVDDATNRGVRIDPVEGSKPIVDPINQNKAVIGGPGGGSTTGIDSLRDTFKDTMNDANANGGWTPREYFDVKRNVGKNANWRVADPDPGVNDARQHIAAGMGGQLVKNIPELGETNQKFQNTGALARRATMRADTGSSPLGTIARRGGELGAGALLGHLTGNPLLGLLPLAADSIPARTAAASSLYYGGKLIPRLAQPTAVGYGIQGAEQRQDR